MNVFVDGKVLCNFSTVLEGQLRNLMDRVDDLNQEAIKFNRYQQAVVRQSTDKHRYLQKRVIFFLIMVFDQMLTLSIFLFLIGFRKPSSSS